MTTTSRRAQRTPASKEAVSALNSRRARTTFRVSKFWSLPVAAGLTLLALNFFQNGPFGLGASRGPIVALLWIGVALAAFWYLMDGIEHRRTRRAALTVTHIIVSSVILLTVVLPVIAYGIALLFNPQFTLTAYGY